MLKRNKKDNTKFDISAGEEHLKVNIFKRIFNNFIFKKKMEKWNKKIYNIKEKIQFRVKRFFKKLFCIHEYIYTSTLEFTDGILSNGKKAGSFKISLFICVKCEKIKFRKYGKQKIVGYSEK